MKNETFNRQSIYETIQPIIENTLMRYDFIPVEIDFQKENHKWFLRVFMYSYNKPVTLDDCEKVSRSLGDFLDEIIPVKYYLEVSSPGLDRKLKSEKEFSIFMNKLIDIKFKKSIDDSNQKVFRAIITDAQPNEYIKVTLLPSKEIITVKYEDIQSAKLVIEDNIGEKDD